MAAIAATSSTATCAAAILICAVPICMADAATRTLIAGLTITGSPTTAGRHLITIPLLTTVGLARLGVLLLRTAGVGAPRHGMASTVAISLPLRSIRTLRF